MLSFVSDLTQKKINNTEELFNEVRTANNAQNNQLLDQIRQNFAKNCVL
jgi:hypothetical protein